MSIIGSNILAGAAGSGVSAYEIEQSLRFDGSSKLSRTPSSASNRKRWTASVWLKIGWSDTTTSNTNYETLLSVQGGGSDSGFNRIYLRTGDLYYGGYTGTFRRTEAYYRDVSAWYHFVIQVDTAAASENDRIKLWVNGVRDTWDSTKQSLLSVTQNQDLAINQSGVDHTIGYDLNDNDYANFYLAEYHLVDGQALTHEDFGEYDDNGVWRPIEVSGLTYGTNGFYLKFDPSATNGIGHDHSGNGNNFTPSGFDTTNTTASTYDVMSDTPTTNWCTLNPLFNNGTEGPGTLSEGNLRHTSDDNYAMCPGTMSLRNGKYYWEAQPVSTETSIAGIIRGTNPGENTFIGYDTNGNVFGFGYSNAGTIYGASGTGTTAGATLATGQTNFTTSDVIGIAVDIPNGTLDWYKNGTLVYSVTGINDDDWFPAVSSYSSETWVVNFGQRAFAYTPPTNFLPLNTSNLSAPDIADGSDYFNTVLYTGNETARSIITGHSSDFVWTKLRNGTQSHQLYDILRGINTRLESDGTGTEAASPNSLTQFNSDGFSLGTSAASNLSGYTYVAWSWDAGGSGSSNTDGSITSTVSANPTAGFSIVSYTGNATDGATVGHGLGNAPQMVICKSRSNAESWRVFHASLPSGQNMYLNGTVAADTITSTAGGGIGTSPTSTTFTLVTGAGGNANNVNINGATYIAYCFAEIEGYSKFGSYTGNSNADNVFVYTGFKPAFLLIKSSSLSVGWVIYDTARNTYNVTNRYLYPNTSGVEGTNNLDIDILSNGFKIRSTESVIGWGGNTYIFAAFASSPFGGDGVSPATAR